MHVAGLPLGLKQHVSNSCSLYKHGENVPDIQVLNETVVRSFKIVAFREQLSSPRYERRKGVASRSLLVVVGNDEERVSRRRLKWQQACAVGHVGKCRAITERAASATLSDLWLGKGSRPATGKRHGVALSFPPPPQHISASSPWIVSKLWEIPSQTSPSMT